MANNQVSGNPGGIPPKAPKTPDANNNSIRSLIRPQAKKSDVEYELAPGQVMTEDEYLSFDPFRREDKGNPLSKKLSLKEAAEVIRRFNAFGKRLDTYVHNEIFESEYVKEEEIVFDVPALNCKNSFEKDLLAISLTTERLQLKEEVDKINSRPFIYQACEYLGEYPDISGESDKGLNLNPVKLNISSPFQETYYVSTVDVEMHPTISDSSIEFHINGGPFAQEPLLKVFYGQINVVPRILDNSDIIHDRRWDDSGQKWLIRVNTRYHHSEATEYFTQLHPENRKGPNRTLRRVATLYFSGRVRDTRIQQVHWYRWSLKVRIHQTGEPDLSGQVMFSHLPDYRSKESPWYNPPAPL